MYFYTTDRKTYIKRTPILFSLIVFISLKNVFNMAFSVKLLLIFWEAIFSTENGGNPTSHTSAHESTAVAAPFQA